MIENNSERYEIKQEIFQQLSRISTRFYDQCKSFGVVWNDLMGKYGFLMENHPIGKLLRDMQSLSDSSQQALYSMERVEQFSTIEASNIIQFYVAHYLWDFLARIKSSTDLLALIITNLFDLSLTGNDCSLEKKKICIAIIGIDKDSDCQLRKELCSILEYNRENWIKAFSELRNLVIHRAGLQYVIGNLPEIGSTMIHIRADQMLRISDEREILNAFLDNVGMKNSSIYGSLLNPNQICKELWILLTGLIDSVFKVSQPKISEFANVNHP